MRTVVRLMWIPVAFALLYVFWIFWQRRQPAAPPPKSARRMEDPLAKYGSAVKILQFYTGSGSIARGEKALICYGVLNAKTVRLDPPAADVWPAVSRCFDVAPTRTTRYTLTAESDGHESVSESLEIVVRRGGA